MNVTMLLDMAVEADPARVAVGGRDDGLTVAELDRMARVVATDIRERGWANVVWATTSGPALAVALFAAARSGIPFVPVNYRLATDRLAAIVARQAPAVVVVGNTVDARVTESRNLVAMSETDLERLARSRSATNGAELSGDGEEPAILLHTSGTSGEPKVAILRHRHLVSYVLGAVEFQAASAREASLVTVPPYHIAGMAAILTGIYSGRRVVHMPDFDPETWVRTARVEGITHAMVVPTMLARINSVLERDRGGIPSLRHLAYGGGRMPLPVIEQAMALLPEVQFVNAYGLTETSSSIAVLDADDHRAALASDDPAVRQRLGSVGRPLPTVEITVRDEVGAELAPGERGEVWVRGDQVSGEYAHGGGLDGGGWFATHDRGWFDDAGYLYVEGRLDDVIVRGGENLSPGEIEDVLLEHAAVAEACVVGVPDIEWGEAVAAVVVLRSGRTATADELADWVVTRLRSSRRPARVEFREALPLNDTGKVLRRVVREWLVPAVADGAHT